jgi:hypothetical protein
MTKFYSSNSSKKQEANPKTSRRKEIIKIRAEIIEIETTKKIQKINETKILFFEIIHKIERPLGKLTKKRREKTQISKIRNEKGKVKQTPQKSRKSSEATSRACTLTNLKILKKWTDF